MVLGATIEDGKVALVAATNDLARARGISAAAVLKAALPAVGGRGGGKDDLAQGGGTESTGIEAAFADAIACVRSTVGT